MFNLARIVDKVSTLIQPFFDEEAYELFDIEYVKEGQDWFLRIYADKPEGVSLDDCVYLSEHISSILDEADPDPIPGTYFLEVSSPGAERPLKSEKAIRQAVGQWVHVNLYQHYDGFKEIEGKLLAISNESLILETKDKTRRIEKEIPRKLISFIRLAIEF